MGKPSLEEKDRNLNLVKDFRSKNFSTVDLVEKYRISTARIYQIIARHDAKDANS